ncbi:putative methyltransferase-domain-containing protein [Coprinopsis sp. MPI-PUGE-AT-0042]|nr:putative methyltransferase-domain-containing protein [Coprinopsis sp. MPI-PUGE-AT-0042]
MRSGASPAPQAPQVQAPQPSSHPSASSPPHPLPRSTKPCEHFEHSIPHTQPSSALASLVLPCSSVSDASISLGKLPLGVSPGSNHAGPETKELATKLRSRANTLTLANRGIFSPVSTGYNTPVIDSGYASAYVSDDEDEDEEGPTTPVDESSSTSCCALLCDSSNLENLEMECKSLEVLRADTFERTFVIRWLTGFVSRAEVWVEEGALVNDVNEVGDADVKEKKEGDDDEGTDEEAGGREYTLRSALLEEALDVLAAFTSVDQTNDEDDEEEDPSYLRTLSFPCPSPVSGHSDAEEGVLTMQINDARINEDDHTSVGLQTWGSSIMFAERLCAQPEVYIPLPSLERRQKPFRILELGAGTGILSIVVEKLFQRGAFGSGGMEREIVATDFHPEVLDNLQKNVGINFSSASPTTSPIDVQTLDWQHPPSHSPFDEPFDLILAADVVYHPEHARWIKGCVEKLLKPDGGVASGRHEGLDETVDEIFGEPMDDASGGVGAACGEQGESGGGKRRLAILETERLGRKSSSVGRADECAYRLFKIGWVR